MKKNSGIDVWVQVAKKSNRLFPISKPTPPKRFTKLHPHRQTKTIDDDENISSLIRSMLFRPLTLSAWVLGFTCVIYSIFFGQPPSELTERNSTKTCHMLGSECDLKMHVKNLGHPLKFGSPKPLIFVFLRLRNLTANGPIFGVKQ